MTWSRSELASATDNSYTLPFLLFLPPRQPQASAHTYRDGMRRYSGGKANPLKKKKKWGDQGERKPRALPLLLVLLLHRFSEATALSVCDGDHAACERMRMDAVPCREGAGTRRVLGSSGACLILCRDLVLQGSRLSSPHISQPACPIDPGVPFTHPFILAFLISESSSRCFFFFF